MAENCKALSIKVKFGLQLSGCAKFAGDAGRAGYTRGDHPPQVDLGAHENDNKAASDMTPSKTKFRLIAAAVLLMTQASSFANGISISLSLSVSGTVASVSNLISKATTTVVNLVDLTNGTYTVTSIAVADERKDQMRLQLQAEGSDRNRDIYLYLPANDYARVDIGVGQTVTASKEDYGLAFYQSLNKTPFVVVLNEDWLADLNARHVVVQ